MSFLAVLIIISLNFKLYSAAEAYSQFLSNPGQKAVTLEVLDDGDSSLVDDGYIFVTPFVYTGPNGGTTRDNGYPHIFDKQGNLVYYGGAIRETMSQDMHTTTFQSNSDKYFLYHDATIGSDGSKEGNTRFFDKNYNQVGPNFGATGNLQAPDGHEANVVGTGGQTMLQDVYQPQQVDLSLWGGPKNGYVIAGCFQEVDLDSDKAIFQWCSTDHVGFNETYVYLRNNDFGGYSSGSPGHGTEDSPWDYFHFNAVTKDSDGNYLVSSRYCATLFKVAGLNDKNPGRIIWRLGGKKNDFQKDFEFGLQHHCRIHEINGNLAISIFDNGWDGHELYFTTPTTNYSRGLLFNVDETSRTATLISEYIQPDKLLAGFAGSTLLLPSGNVFMGWGMQPFVSEHSSDGKTLFYATLGDGKYSSYRAFKDSWTGTPKTPPDVFAYARTCSSTVQVYVSWNGATEVSYWKLYTGSTPSNMKQRGSQFIKTTGFETQISISTKDFPPVVKIEAYDQNNNLLGQSNSTVVFVPKKTTAASEKCGKESCGFDFDYSTANSMASQC